MKAGLYQFQHKKICAGFEITTRGWLVLANTAPIVRAFYRRYGHSWVLKRSKWIDNPID